LLRIQRVPPAQCSLGAKDDTLLAYFEYVGQDFEVDIKKMAADLKTQEWWAIMDPMRVPIPTRAEIEWWAQMEEVFDTD
jgi:L-rhamnose mutarotase